MFSYHLVVFRQDARPSLTSISASDTLLRMSDPQIPDWQPRPTVKRVSWTEFKKD